MLGMTRHSGSLQEPGEQRGLEEYQIHWYSIRKLRILSRFQVAITAVGRVGTSNKRIVCFMSHTWA